VTQSLAGVLILAATPIGDPRDAAPRLTQEIATADVVAAEDTRRFTRLCRSLEVKPSGSVVSYHEHNEATRTADLLHRLVGGARVLVVTDAGMPSVSDPGYRLVVAAVEAGVALDRFVRVAEPGEQWPSVVASLLEAFDIVVIHPPPRAREADMRRLSARARERSAVLLVTGNWEAAALGLTVIEQRWHGLGSGHGYLQAHELEVQSLGRGAAVRPRRTTVWLPQAL